MVAADINVCDMSAIVVSRKPLLCRGIADRWIGLLRGNRVELDVAAVGATNTVRPLPTHLNYAERG